MVYFVHHTYLDVGLHRPGVTPITKRALEDGGSGYTVAAGDLTRNPPRVAGRTERPAHADVYLSPVPPRQSPSLPGAPFGRPQYRQESAAVCTCDTVCPVDWSRSFRPLAAQMEFAWSRAPVSFVLFTTPGGPLTSPAWAPVAPATPAPTNMATDAATTIMRFISFAPEYWTPHRRLSAGRYTSYDGRSTRPCAAQGSHFGHCPLNRGRPPNGVFRRPLMAFSRVKRPLVPGGKRCCEYGDNGGKEWAAALRIALWPAYEIYLVAKS